MGSAQTAKNRLVRLTWPDWARRVDTLLAGADLSRSQVNYPFRAAHYAGVPPALVALEVIRQSDKNAVKRVGGE